MTGQRTVQARTNSKRMTSIYCPPVSTAHQYLLADPRDGEIGRQAGETHTMSPIFIVTLPDLWIRSFPILPDGSAGWRKYDPGAAHSPFA